MMRKLIAALFVVALCGCKSAPAPNTPFAEPATTERRAELRSESRERRTRSNSAESSAQPGDFDFYLLNLSWSPEFCTTHPSSPECASHPGFVVHGLWPQNDSGQYPENCSNAPGPANPQSDTDLMPTASLVEHEWKTHGTCTGLAADAYFRTVRKAYHSVKLPTDLGNRDPNHLVSPNAILDEFRAANPGFPAQSFALSCGNNQLTAVESCFTKDLQPEACQGIRTCRASVIRITPQ